jgi:hypothetical protein
MAGAVEERRYCVCRKRIERNQIHLGRHVAQNPHQLVGVLNAVIDAFQHHVLEGHAAARRIGAVAPAGLEQFG